ncbi:MAG: transcription antitermination factor NusB [Lachnospiraceae bacterium]|jgi:N utilization substance protein B
MTRRELREHIFRILFTRDFDSNDAGEQADLYLNDVDGLTQEEADYIRSKTVRIWQMIPELDEMIGAESVGWTVERMGTVDRTLLRLALYEMKYEDDVPAGVAINEAVELAKKYGTDSSYSFVNGILAKLAKEE